MDTSTTNTAARDTFELWFFRDLTEDQRMSLFRLAGLPVEEIVSQAAERLSIRYVTNTLTQQQGGEQEGGGVRWTSFTKPDGAGGFTIDPSVLDSPLYADQMRAVKEMARGKHKETTEETKLRTKQPAASEEKPA